MIGTPVRTGPARAVAVGAALLLAATACSRADRADEAAGPADLGPAAELRLGYFPNVTHAAAVAGVSEGLFAEELGDTELVTQTFNAGPDAVGALLGASLDATFLGSNPALTAFQESGGAHTRLIAGATSGGAQLVVRSDIDRPEDLLGESVATPQLANTQDVAARKWLVDLDLPSGDGPDRVAVQNIRNPDTLTLFREGAVAGGWLPEPWASRLVVEADAEVLVDERDRWDDGAFPTTVLVVRTQYLREHPETVEALVRGLLRSTDWVEEDLDRAKGVVNAELDRLAGAPLDQAVLDRAFENIDLDLDPLAATFPRLAEDAVAAGLSSAVPDLQGLVDVGPLNAVLAEAGRPPVDDAGLGEG
ncbi:ABC transporter substrate-binding protein [Actinoalloteichus spitiensis]|uniref:ABC transporter substrate-binding protein n=1 Tax=Actinoalloteichus spitiensis TaxID=252394 RepID=UPI000364C168|nr:ABC transporter substrate-binding protein [Actinoalloteichus spitiensis]